jgi:hypothetical protein
VKLIMLRSRLITIQHRAVAPVNQKTVLNLRRGD